MRAYEIISEKAVSKKQQQFFGIVRAMQKGDMPKSGEAGDVAKDMKKSDVKDFAKTKHKGLPTKKKTNEGAEITVYTDPSYQGATLDDKYWNSKPSQQIDFDKLEPFEPESKMHVKKSADNMKRFVDKIKAGKEIKPIIVTPKDGKYLILDGHHRYFAARIAKVDSMEAVIVPEKFVTFTDEVPDESEQHKQQYHKEEAAGVGIVTKQNATADVPVGGEYMNVKKLFPKKKKKKESIAYEDMFQGLNPKSEIYVDMDGVLADFFGEWKKLVGKDWRELDKDEIEPALKKIRDEDKFWLNIPLTSNAKNLLGIIKQVKGDYKILSSPLANDPNSEPHKREWIEKNLDFFPPTEVIITKDKAKYATNPDGTPNILIDDYGVNIAAWESAGGIGFKHKDHKFERTAKKLKAEIEESFQQLIREHIEEISAKDIGAGALAGLMALTPVSKAFGQDADTNPLPNKQTSTMVQKDVAGKKDLSKIQASAKKDYWKVTINYKGKDVDLKLPFSAGSNKNQIKQFIDDMMSDQGVKDYQVKDIDTLNKVSIDQSIVKKLIKELEKRNGKQSISYLAGMAKRAGAKPGADNAHAIAAMKAYLGK